MKRLDFSPEHGLPTYQARVRAFVAAIVVARVVELLRYHEEFEWRHALSALDMLFGTAVTRFISSIVPEVVVCIAGRIDWNVRRLTDPFFCHFTCRDAIFLWLVPVLACICDDVPRENVYR